MPTTKALISPVYGSDRFEILDIFRGFALFGIYLVNIRFMSSSVLYPEEFSWMNTGILNKIVWWMIQHFFNEKFFPIFSFLFGVGFGIQISRMEEKGTFSVQFFIRRYLLLFIFGLFHIIFIWPGDVLALYAISGAILLIIRKFPNKLLLLLSLIILVFPFYIHLRNHFNQIIIGLGGKSLLFLYDYSYTDIVNLKINGSFFEKVSFRIHEYSVYYRNAEYFPLLLSMIILGYTAGRVKFYNNISYWIRRLKKFMIASLFIVIFAHVVYFSINTPQSFMIQILLKKLIMMGNILQSFIYLYLIAILYEKKILIKYLEPLSYAGRMSLTNYIMQSVLAVFIFRGFIKLYGQFGLASLELLGIIVFTGLVIGSQLWLKKFRYGPIEWIWRQFSYINSVTINIQNK